MSYNHGSTCRDCGLDNPLHLNDVKFHEGEWPVFMRRYKTFIHPRGGNFFEASVYLKNDEFGDHIPDSEIADECMKVIHKITRKREIHIYVVRH